MKKGPLGVRLNRLTPRGEQPLTLPPPSAGAVWVLGRSANADVFINDAAASRRHCEIRHTANAAVLVPLGRTDTRCNGEILNAEISLADGDRIEIGSVVLVARIKSAEPLPSSIPESLDARESAMPAAPRIPAQRRRTPSIDLPESEPAADAAHHTFVQFPGHSMAAPTGQPPVPADLIIAVDRKELIIGRDAACHVPLDHPAISRRHVRIARLESGFVIKDLGSANGTFLNGERLEGAARLLPGAGVRIGPFDFCFDGVQLALHRDASEGVAMELRGVGKHVRDRRTGSPLPLLANISLTVRPGEFVGIFGSSGCGKSTLMDAMNGRRPASEGVVLYRGQNLYDRFESFKAGIGYVPQELIFHSCLTVHAALHYAGQLRLPPDTSDAELNENIDRVLDHVKLTHRKSTRIDRLSGGQKKRVSIAIELLSKPNVLFLDEATSGLDSLAEAQMMRIFREVADRGVTTLCITHHADSLEQCDLVAYLIKGRLAFFGPPSQLPAHFGVADYRDVLTRESERTPEEWEAAFQQSPQYRQYVAARSDRTVGAVQTRTAPGEAIASVRAAARHRQFKTLVCRYARVLTSDRRALVLLLLLAPMIGVLTRVRFRDTGSVPAIGQVVLGMSQSNDNGLVNAAQRMSRPVNQSVAKRTPRQNQQQRFDMQDIEERVGRQARQVNLGFCAVLAMFFMGIFGSVREVVKELPVYRHERFVNLEILPYLASKIGPLGLLNALQAVAMYSILACAGGVALGQSWAYDGAFLLTLFLTAFTATTLGLAVSCIAESSDKAILIMIVLVIVQILFTNAFGILDGALRTIGQWLVPVYWAQDLVTGCLDGTLWWNADPKATPRPPSIYAGLTGFAALAGFCALYVTLAAAFLRIKDGKVYAIPGEIRTAAVDGVRALRRIRPTAAS